jgi:hypothetical protein
MARVVRFCPPVALFERHPGTLTLDPRFVGDNAEAAGSAH